jgi:membrane-associated phospholipid phosphatase
MVSREGTMSRTRRLRRIVTGLAAALPALLLACADQPTAPATTDPSSTAVALDRGRGERSSGELAAVTWEMKARDLVAAHNIAPGGAVRMFALLGVAQHGAATAVDPGRGRAQQEAVRGAIGGASVQVLSFLFPDAATGLEAQLAAEGNGTQPEFTLGVTTGRTTGDAMKAWARADGFSLPWDHRVLPSGPGYWIPLPNVAPIGFQLPTTHAYFLQRNDQFMPAPPPAFGTFDFDANLAVTRFVAGTRGPREIDIANLWNLSNGTMTPAGHWLTRAAGLLATSHLSERDAAHLFALMNAAEMDALIGCFTAKYQYLLLRPSQADPSITQPLGPVGFPYVLPNHPSYPSGHSCVSGAAVTVLEAAFPSQTDALDAELQEAGLSRIIGGIHYPIDILAGQTLGRETAEWAMTYDRSRGLLSAVGLARSAALADAH